MSRLEWLLAVAAVLVLGGGVYAQRAGAPQSVALDEYVRRVVDRENGIACYYTTGVGGGISCHAVLMEARPLRP